MIDRTPLLALKMEQMEDDLNHAPQKLWGRREQSGSGNEIRETRMVSPNDNFSPNLRIIGVLTCHCEQINQASLMSVTSQDEKITNQMGIFSDSRLLKCLSFFHLCQHNHGLFRLSRFRR